ncbi:MAG: hypothetical protein FWG73_00455, partial [Planctomycetaceae bacterium]|nr:hypothetical protein [Planctomycetaceae bacterium]
CVVLGIALLAFVGIAMSGVFEPVDPGLVKVGNGEAQLVLGGGVPGASFAAVSCSGTYGCGASGPSGIGPGDQRRVGSKSCGGTCSPVLATKVEAAPE